MPAPNYLNQHDPCCRATYKQHTPPVHCADCDLATQVRNNERQHLINELRNMAPLCREPSVAVSRTDCTCWAGINAAITVLEETP